MIDRLVTYLWSCITAPVRYLLEARRLKQEGLDRQRQQIEESIAHVHEAAASKVAIAKTDNIISVEVAKVEIAQRKRDVDNLRRTLEELVVRVNRDPVHRPRLG